MKLRILLLALVAFALSASTALAHDKGGEKHAKAHAKAQQAKKDKKANRHNAEVCRPAVGVKLRGEITRVTDPVVKKLIMPERLSEVQPEAFLDLWESENFSQN